jgi:hypothetical protein
MTDIVVYDQNEGIDVFGQCDSIERWAAECDSVPQLRDAGHKLAAIDEYLSRTTTEARARVAVAMRHLEARIGDLLGPAEHGGDRRESKSTVTDLSKDQRSDFRLMAKHPDIVEEVIANSTDEEPASRRKVIEAIKTKTAKQEPKAEKPRRAPLPDSAQKAAWDYRKSVERLERIVEDDRFAANKEAVAAHLRGHLAYGIEVGQDLFNQLSEEP